MNPTVTENRNQSTSAQPPLLEHSDAVFESLFQHSPDAIWLYDPQSRVLIDCNQAAVELMGAGCKEEFLPSPAEMVSPEIQHDGVRSSDKTTDVIAMVEKNKGHHFEWTIRRRDGREVPVEVTATAVVIGGRSIYVVISRDITERKQAERELLELTQVLERRVTERTAALTTSEARLRALVENAPEAIVVFNGDTGRFLFGNQHASDLYGVPMARLAELTPADVSPEFQADGRRSSELADEKMAEALRGGTPVFEWIHRQPGGRLVPTEVRLLRLPAEGQNLIRASIIDNTERKRAEELLNERVSISTLNAEVAVALNAGCGLSAMLQRCLELVVRHLDVAFARVWTLNEGTQTLELQASAGCYTHLDGPHSRVKVGEFKIGLIAQEKKPHLTNHVQSDARVSDKTWAAREGMLAFAGYPLMLESRVLGVLAMFARRPLANDILQTIGSIADSLALGIERKRFEGALAESEARFGSAFNASPALIGILRTSDEKYVLVNDAHLNWLGYPREEVIGRSCLEMGMWEDLAERDLLLKDVLASGSVRQRECRWRNRHGERFTMLLSVETINLNETPHILSMALDITQRKNAEVEMRRALAREKELSQLKSNFVSMVSHEFRTPLGIIQSSAELLRDYFSKMEATDRDDQLESISRNTRRMAGMMEEILVLSRLDAGKLEYEPSNLDLNLFCPRVVDEVLSATGRRCPIEISFSSIPPEAKADDRLLGHIFTNLLSNAVKYSEAGAMVYFSIKRDGREAVCSVIDQGIGISPDDQKGLFTAFHRGSNVGTRPGTGLGLLVVKRCVDLHGGSIEILSQLGKGTIITVRLPVFA